MSSIQRFVKERSHCSIHTHTSTFTQTYIHASIHCTFHCIYVYIIILYNIVYINDVFHHRLYQKLLIEILLAAAFGREIHVQDGRANRLHEEATGLMAAVTRTPGGQYDGLFALGGQSFEIRSVVRVFLNYNSLCIIHAYAHICTCLHVFQHIRMYICIYILASIIVHVYILACILVCMWT